MTPPPMTPPPATAQPGIPRPGDLPVARLEARAYEVPTDQPEADGTLEWDSTTVVVVRAATEDGTVGTGWTYASAACVPLVTGELSSAVLGRDALDVPGVWEAMVRRIRNLGRPGLVSCAVAAVDIALWDLKARLLGLPLSRVLGQVRSEVPLYGSGGFTTYDDDRLRAQLERWVGEQGLSRVKIKIGESWGRREDRDLARTAFTRQVVGDTVEVLVDANGGYGPGQAARVGRALGDLGVTWFEEPVTSDDLAGLAAVRAQVAPDVTAGEYGSDLVYFRRMLEAGAVDCVQPDVTRTAGITEWLRVAAVAASFGIEVSAHTAPTLHLHPALAVPNLRHVELFHDHERIEARFFDGAPQVRDGVLRPELDRPGLGVELREADVEDLRVA